MALSGHLHGRLILASMVVLAACQGAAPSHVDAPPPVVEVPAPPPPVVTHFPVPTTVSMTVVQPVVEAPRVQPVVEAPPVQPPVVEAQRVRPPVVEAAPPVQPMYAIRFVAFPPTPVAVVARSVDWAELVDVREPVTFVRMRRGVLGKGEGDRTYGVSPTGSFAQVDIKIPGTASRFLGDYPEDSWILTLDPTDSSAEARQLRRWHKDAWKVHRLWDAPPGSNFGLSVENLEKYRFAKAGKYGVLMGEMQDGKPAGLLSSAREPMLFVSHVPAKNEEANVHYIHEQGVVTGICETKLGRTYVFVDIKRGEQSLSIAQWACGDSEDCVEHASGFPTADGSSSQWWFTSVVPRGGAGLSMVGVETRKAAGGTTSEEHRWMVHVDKGVWTIESLPDGAEPTYAWSIEDGGLWAEVKSPDGYALMHRDPQGKWSRVGLPDRYDGSTQIELALTPSGKLWLIGKVDGQLGVWETASVSPPLAPSPAG